MPYAYEAISTNTLSSNTSSIVFSSIPATYTDLRIILNSLSSTGNTQFMTFNTDTSTNYSYTQIYGNSSTASFRTSSAVRINIGSDIEGASATIPTLITIDIFSYAGSTYKTCLVNQSEELSAAGITSSKVGLWRSTDAINRIVIDRTGGNYLTGTIATLYGIKNA